MRSQVRSAYFNLCLALLGVIISFLVAEILVRNLMPAPAIGFIDVGRFRLSANPKLLVEPVPYSFPLKDVSKESDSVRPHLNQGFLGQANHLGLRDVERSLNKMANSTRVLVLGDSVTMGYGVHEDKSLYPVIAESYLRDQGIETEFMNFGISTYNTAQEVEFFYQHGLAYKPDIVVLQYCLNDDEDPFPANRALFSRLLELETAKDKLSQIKSSALSRVSHIYRFWELRNSKPQYDMRDHDLLSKEPIKNSLLRLKQLSEAHKFKLYVLGVPSQNLDTSQADVNELNELQSMASSMGIPASSALSALVACNQESSSLFIDIYHLNPNGHKCLGLDLANTLRRNFSL